ncbi:1,25-dihydroxyvitamin D(3) 24-hydroxylase, mitochondrial-like [Ptychodera flava]|uniref:1,25-dihydroxyvitamin D(3) 24-hydroxylase, mitochondrial-like n=1 Tax=Ptychodera flava TaxID=63121 RepID=UPI003969E535
MVTSRVQRVYVSFQAIGFYGAKCGLSSSVYSLPENPFPMATPVISMLMFRYVRTGQCARFAVNVRHRQLTTAAPQSDGVGSDGPTSNRNDVKPFEDIPRSKSKLSTYIDLFRHGGLSRMDKYILWRRQTFGPIWREIFGIFDSVIVADPVAAEAVTRAEGKYPRRQPVEPWLLYRKLDGYSIGVFLAEGEEWQRHRTVLNKPLLRPKEVASHTSTLNDVADDLVAKIRRVHAKSDKTSLNDDVYRWSMEGIAATLFERRLGLLRDAVDPRSEEFIQAVKDFFKYTESLVYLPLKLQVKLNMPAWKGLRRAAKTLFDVTEFHMKETIASKGTGDGSREIISYLYSTGKLSDGEILADATELFSAAVDTTSTTMIWVLDLLAWNEDVQQKLYQEISSVVPKGQEITQEHLRNLHYIKAVVRESMRLYPVAPASSRILASDVVLCGYHVPAETVVVVHTGLMSRDPELFEDPDKFLPERWMRSEQQIPRVNQYAAQPFAMGPRQCIGRRLAELEMYLCIAKIIQNFVLEPNNDQPLQPRLRFLQIGDKPLRLKFHDRI